MAPREAASHEVLRDMDWQNSFAKATGPDLAQSVDWTLELLFCGLA